MSPPADRADGQLPVEEPGDERGPRVLADEIWMRAGPGRDRRQARSAVSVGLKLVCGHAEQDLSTLRWLADAR